VCAGHFIVCLFQEEEAAPDATFIKMLPMCFCGKLKLLPSLLATKERISFSHFPSPKNTSFGYAFSELLHIHAPTFIRAKD